MNGLLTDLYELTMAAGFFEAGKTEEKATFELAFRRLPAHRNFVLSAGLPQVVEYLLNLRFNDDEVDYLRGLAQRATKPGYRGCGLTNAAVEYPESAHPARKVAEAHKRALRERLVAMAKRMGASDPRALGDGLLLLIEGTFASGQLFGKAGPARALVDTAERLIDASMR